MDQGSGSFEEATLDSCFVTPILQYVWPDSAELNARLRELLLEEERADTTKTDLYTNVGGWHSKVKVQEMDNEDIRTVLSRFQKMAEEMTRRTIGLSEDKFKLDYTLYAWANIHRNGGYNMPHLHECPWGGVYYVALGESNKENQRSGVLEFQDPRPAAMMVHTPGKFFTHRYFAHPYPGLMIVFPGWLSHFVNPFFGQGERICISCNIYISEEAYM